jgi:hypothetical protein
MIKVFGSVILGLSTLVAASQPASSPVHVVVRVKGQVEIARNGGSIYQPASFGMLLHDSDMIRLGDAAELDVVCSDLSLMVPLPRRFSGTQCQTASATIVQRSRSLVMSSRGEATLGPFPRVLRPRGTRLLNATPEIRWSPVPGASDYRVSIENTNWSKDVHGDAHVTYPKDAPTLAPAREYLVKITTLAPPNVVGLSSTAEHQPNVGFTIASPQTASNVAATQKRIEQLQISAEGKKYLIALLLAENDLNAEAIDVLEGLWPTVQESAIGNKLGDLYITVGLGAVAADWYAHALQHAHRDEDRARALEGLTMTKPQDRKAAKESAKAAFDLYSSLGDSEAAKRMEKVLTMLAKSPQ